MGRMMTCDMGGGGGATGKLQDVKTPNQKFSEIISHISLLNWTLGKLFLVDEI